MNPALQQALSVNGTIAEVRDFCRVSDATIFRWLNGPDGVVDLPSFKNGRNTLILECDLVEFVVRNYRVAAWQQRFETRDQVRAAWREHIGFRRAQERDKLFAEMDARVARLERKMQELMFEPEIKIISLPSPEPESITA